MKIQELNEINIMKYQILTLILTIAINTFGQTNYPFPNHTTYVGNHIKPDNYTQTELDNQLQSFYDEWKLQYLKNDCGNMNEYYVFSGNGAKNVSEAQGYGMMITAYLAGYDANAQVYFDGLYAFYKSHPSNINSFLMDWEQVTCNDAPSSDDDAASDGDIDIAYALLLAHCQWGSNGNINYLSEAQLIINAIMLDEINQNTWTVKLGDWSNSSDQNYFYGTRPSDFITDHFRIFSCFNNNWNTVIDTCYSLIENMQTNFSSTTGLIPDFINNIDTSPNPAPPDYLEDTTDGSYSYNACRVPWRLGTDYLLNGEIKAKTALDKINDWLYSSTNGNVLNISNGYNLNGTAQFNWNDATFIGPFTVGAMLDTANQTWLNNLYENLLTQNNLVDGDYYSNTIKLLSMIVVSENYWTPDCNMLAVDELNIQDDNFIIYPNSTNGKFHVNSKFTTLNDMSFKIVDINGKTLMKNFSVKNNQVIDISAFNSGIYFISIYYKNRYITKKIIKE